MSKFSFLLKSKHFFAALFIVLALPNYQEVKAFNILSTEFEDEDKREDESNSRWLNFSDSTSKLGSIGIGGSNGAQSIQFNALNYDLKLGDDVLIPFQVFIASNTPASGDQENIENANAATLMDPTAGLALNFPIIYKYNKSGGGICSFANDLNSGCFVGGEITLNFMNLENTEGKTETAYGKTIRLGAGFRFPILEEAESKGFLSLSGKLIYSSFGNVDDSTSLFTPVTDVNGTAIKFDDSIFSSELEMKIDLNDLFSISAKWIKPFNSEEYFDDRFQLILEKQF